MAENTGIEWADHTFNPWLGCTKVSPGCDHCYAERERAIRILGVQWGAAQPRHRTAVSTWRKPRRWDAAHPAFFDKHGRRQRVFCASLADVFDNAVPAQWRADLLQLIRETPNLDWLVLTKRVGNARAMLNEAVKTMTGGATTWDTEPIPNLWLGATVVNPAEMHRDIPKLLDVPAAVKFLSMEPLLGHPDISEYLTPGWPHCASGFTQGPQYETGYCGTCGGHRTDPIHDPSTHDYVDWVIVGGESGPDARPMHPQWVRDVRDQCRTAGTAFFFKQWGDWIPADQADQSVRDAARMSASLSISGCLRHDEDNTIFATGEAYVLNVGKKRAGCELDGQRYQAFPNVSLELGIP